MKFSLLLILTLQIFSLRGQSVVNNYRNYFGNELEIKSDSTFYWNYHFDLASGWAKGKWVLKMDTLVLKPIPTFDTLVRNGKRDSLVLSLNEISQKVTEEQFAVNQISSGGQLLEYVPTKLLYRKKRLYTFKRNGKIRKSKMKGILTKKKFVPWFFEKE